MRDPAAVVRRFYHAFNTGDLGVYAELLAEDIVVEVDVHTLRGPGEVLGYVAGVRHAFPGITVEIERLVTDGEHVVCELRQHNPVDTWRLAGTVCELIRVRDDRIASIRSYYAAHPEDRTSVTLMPTRNEAYRIGNEQAALRRVATLVAKRAPEDELFRAVNEGIAHLVGAYSTSLFRFEPDDTLTLLAAWADGDVSFPTGDRRPLNAQMRDVRATGAARRFDVLPDSAPFVEEARALGIRSAVGVPIWVDERVWGIVFASSREIEPLPDDTEQRIAGFAELVSTALSNAQSRAGLQQLAAEQAALRRVAESIARGAPVDEALHAIAAEACHLAGADYATVGRFGPDGSSTLVAVHDAPDAVAVGDREPPGGPCMLQEVRRSGLPVRIERYEGRSPAEWESACRLGVTGGAAAPIFVDGELWGGLSALTYGPLIPVGLEDRLAQFAALAGAALSDAHARSAMRSMADEQAALRRVAELVARGVEPDELFASVADEASRLIDDEATTLLRFDDHGWATVIATRRGPAPVGASFAVSPDDKSTPARILHTGQPARVDDYGALPGLEYARDYRVGSSVGAPIVVEDRVWGMLGATTPDRRLPMEAERRLQQFAELVAAALANTLARAEIQHLADEQAALRRVAELVASGVASEEVLDAVVVEASRLLGDAGTALSRYEPDGAVVVATCRSPAPVGLRVAVEGDTCHAQVLRTGRPYRVRSFTETPLDGIARELGVESAVGVPVVVEGRTWGLLSATVPGRSPPAGAEKRLAQFARLIGTAIANAEARAQLTASRARVVAAADESRRRVQRDVHDGAQQRLVQTVITLKLAKGALEDGRETASELVEEALVHAVRASTELRDLVRGILPASLSRGGLRAGVESLAADLPLPVDVHASVPRLPEATETTAYFVVAEALTNVVKHAQATAASVRAAIDGDVLCLEIRDDGVGGADAQAGSGLTGLFDRVEAGEGTLVIDSSPGQGTTLCARLPVRADT